jgi:hypothetical protein
MLVVERRYLVVVMPAKQLLSVPLLAVLSLTLLLWPSRLLALPMELLLL